MRFKMLMQAVVVAALLPVMAAAEPVVYKVNGAHSSVGFTIRHMVSEVDGRFNKFDGTIKYDRQNPAASSVQFTAQCASITTDNEQRDGHLRSPDFFDCQKFPTLSFTSSGVTAKDANNLQVGGNLTIRGVTKQVTLPVTVLGVTKGMDGNDHAGFKTSLTINRQDYGVAWNKAIEGAGTILSDDVTFTIKIEADRVKDTAPPK